MAQLRSVGSHPRDGWGGGPPATSQITPIQALVGEVTDCIIFGYLTQRKEGTYVLEDPDAYVELDLRETVREPRIHVARPSTPDRTRPTERAPSRPYSPDRTHSCPIDGPRAWTDNLGLHGLCILQQTAEGLFTEGCTVLVEGSFADGIFTAKVLGFPPPEPAAETRSGGGSPHHPAPCLMAYVDLIGRVFRLSTGR